MCECCSNESDSQYLFSNGVTIFEISKGMLKRDANLVSVLIFRFLEEKQVDLSLSNFTGKTSSVMLLQPLLRKKYSNVDFPVFDGAIKTNGFLLYSTAIA